MTFSAEWPYLLLHHVPGLGPKTLQRAQQFITNPSHLLVQDADFWQNKVRLPLAGWQAIAQWQQHPQQSDLYQNAARDAEWQAAAPIHHIIHRHHADYPPQLAVLHDPPNLLYIRGAVAALSQPQIAVVGARAASRTGLQLARQFGRSLSEQGWLVTSGLALGIDGAVHQGCLDAGYPTLAVLGAGLERIYPHSHQWMADAIVEQGALVSEFPVHAGPKPYHFPQRNRIIAGLCQGLLVVEAAEKSGSLITAQMAVDGGKEVFAVPGNPLNPLSRGCHRLIQQGAGLVADTQDLLDVLGDHPMGGQQPRPITHVQTPTEPSASPVLQWVSYDGSSFAQIEADSGLAADVLMRDLMALELDGAIGAQQGGFCRLR